MILEAGKSKIIRASVPIQVWRLEVAVKTDKANVLVWRPSSRKNCCFSGKDELWMTSTETMVAIYFIPEFRCFVNESDENWLGCKNSI